MSSLLGLISGNGDPYYSLSQTTTSVNEGSSVVFTLTTVNVLPSSTFYWTTTGTVNANDFQGGATSGNFTTDSNGTGTLSLSISTDYTSEGPESFQLQVRTGSVTGNIVSTSSTITVIDSSSGPSYSVSPSTANVNEGSSVTFTISTNGVANATTLYYTLNPISGTINSSDFSSGSLNGSFTISGASGTFNTGGSGTVSYTLENDLTLEGSESFQLQIRTGSISGTIVATSSTVTINDTSVPTYSISPSATSLNEGSSVTFTVTTTGVTNGTSLFYTLSSIVGSITDSDFSSGATSGSFTINSNSGSVTFTLANDVTTEGNEQFQFQVRTGSTTGSIVATSSTVTINDTSSTGTASYLVVGGGGGGGGSQVAPGAYAGGGGGAGGYLTGSFTYTLGSQYLVGVGQGGAGGYGAFYNGVAGGESTFGPITAKGGGGGLSAGAFPTSPSTIASGGGGPGPYAQPYTGSTINGELAPPPAQGYKGGFGYGYSTEPNSPTVPSTDPTYYAYTIKNYAIGGGGGGSGGSGGDAGTYGAGFGGYGTYSPLVAYTLAAGGGGGSGAAGNPLGSYPTYVGPGGQWSPYPSLPAGNASAGGGIGAAGPSSPGDTYNASYANGGNGTQNYGGGGGGGGVWGRSPGPVASTGGAGGSGIVAVAFPSLHTITIGSGLVYGAPNPTTRIFYSGSGYVTFNLA